jgi:hypothetical protein
MRLKAKKLTRDSVITIVGCKSLIGVYFEGSKDIILECNPEKADKLIALWNNAIKRIGI